jgi:uncharacterized protein YecE (DUF72 family)
MLKGIYRGLILVAPHGTYIKRGIKRTIIKSVNFPDISHKPLLLIEGKLALGILYLGDPKAISLEQFKNRGSQHQITEKERLEWWKGKSTLYEYKITRKQMFDKPVRINYKQGPQIVVKPENIWIVTSKSYRIGTSGYQYDSWHNRFYPKGVDEFDYYSKRFNSVEINYTFYKIPSLETWKRWYDESPVNFVFSIKLNQYLVNKKDLHNDKRFNEFMIGLTALKGKMGCLLVQYNSRFKYKPVNLQKVISLIKQIRRKDRTLDVAFEFRDVSWFNDTVYDVMKRYSATIAISHVNRLGGWTGLEDGFNPSLDKFVKTADYVYVRLHGTAGQYIGRYDTKTIHELTNFLERLKVKRVYLYFNNTDSSDGMPDAIIDAKKLYYLSNNE